MPVGGAMDYALYRLRGQTWVLMQTIDSPPATIFPGHGQQTWGVSALAFGGESAKTPVSVKTQ